MLFGKTERLEGDIDRTEELVLLDSVVTPNGHLRSKQGKSHAKKAFAYLMVLVLLPAKGASVYSQVTYGTPTFP